MGEKNYVENGNLQKVLILFYNKNFENELKNYRNKGKKL